MAIAFHKLKVTKSSSLKAGQGSTDLIFQCVRYLYATHHQSLITSTTNQVQAHDVLSGQSGASMSSLTNEVPAHKIHCFIILCRTQFFAFHSHSIHSSTEDIHTVPYTRSTCTQDMTLNSKSVTTSWRPTI